MKAQNFKFPLLSKLSFCFVIFMLLLISCIERNTESITVIETAQNTEQRIPAPLDQKFKKEQETEKVTKRIIGDPIDVINLNRENYSYLVNGKSLDYEKAIAVIAASSDFNVSLEIIDSKTVMTIETFNISIGPKQIDNKSNC